MSDLHSLFFLLRLIEIVVSHHVMVSVELVAHQLLLRSMTWAAGGTYVHRHIASAVDQNFGRVGSPIIP